MKSAEISGTNQLSAKLSKKVSTDDLKGKVTVTDADGKAVDVKSLKADGTKVIITADKDLDVRGKYTVEIKAFGSQNAIAGSVVRSRRLRQEVRLQRRGSGRDLHQEADRLQGVGADRRQGRAHHLQVRRPECEIDQTIDMTSESKGVWSATVKKLASGTAYSYRLTFADGTVNTSADPYATAAVANGERSVVLSKKAMGKAGKRMPAFGKTTDAPSPR